MNVRRLVVLLLGLALGSSSFAELRLARLFSDGMVLQREQKIAVWGWADAGAEVKVSFGGQRRKTKAKDDGSFMLRLKRMKTSAEARTMKVTSGADAVLVKDVLVGEVWLCSGQSNMQWPVKSANNFEEEKAAANYPRIRMFLTDLTANTEPQADCTGSWEVCSPDNVGEFSATAYFFGRKLHEDLDVPIGLIRSCWGGTPIRSWSSLSSLQQYSGIMELKATMDSQAERFDEAAEEKRFARVLEDWKANVKKAKEDGKSAPRRPRKRIHPHKSQRYPGNLYNAMIYPLVPFGMRGAIWYQGEANAHSIEDAVLYRDLLENMVDGWRSDWGDRFPFYAVQLVNFKAPQVEPVEDTGWSWIRESFLKFQAEVPDTGIAVGIDVGEEKDIHPKNKQDIGKRLAQQALAKTYGRDIVAGGPLYRSMETVGDTIVLKFDDIGSGLASQDGAELKTFAIAGSDRRFVEAEAKIVGDTVVVRSDAVQFPLAVRYAWADNPVGCNLANENGFPASPFRTDDWAPVTGEK
ncbi:sialate O-acetylesterase [Pelagicoccus mobilis]|nr:sialate O-acetylesterase [Pelagicoccus mobilis]